MGPNSFTKVNCFYFKSNIIHVHPRFFWPWARNIAFTHDSYNCKKFSYCHPFPTKRLPGIGNYVGNNCYNIAEIKMFD